MQTLAKIAAYLLHPILIPIYLVLFLVELEPVMSLYFNGELKWRFIVAMLVNVVAGPLVSMWILKRNGVISSYTMPHRQGRTLIFMITAGWYLLTYFLVQRIGLPIVTEALFIGLMVTLVLLALISRRHKTSAHMAALGGVLGVLSWMFAFYGIWQLSWFLIVILITALQASFRLLLNAHTESEVLSGWLVGLVSTFAVLFLMVH